MRALKTMLTVIGAVTVLVLAVNTAAYAATGGKFILGKINKANKTSVLKRTTSGPALTLGTKSGADAPLAVNGTGKVTNLNADRLDGLDSTDLQTSTYVFTKSVTSATSSLSLTIPVPAGSYVINYSAYMNGGGSDGSRGGCYLTKHVGPSSTYFAEERQLTSTSDTAGFSGAGAVTLGAGDTLTLNCSMPGSFTTFSNEPIQVTATRTAIAGSSALRVAPSGRVAPKN